MKKVITFIFMLTTLFIVVACTPTSETGEKTIEFIDSGNDQLSPITLEVGDYIPEPETPSYLTYEFGGWFEDSRYTKAWDFDQDTVKKDTKLYAKWTTKITQTVSVPNGLNSEGEVVYKKEVTESVIRINPKVVVTFALEIADMFKVVGFENTGITYFGLPKSNLPESIKMFESNKYPNTGDLFNPNYDTLDLMMPELIIIGGRSSNLYDTLKTKYPHTDVIDVSNTTFSFEKQKEVIHALSLIFPSIRESLETQQLLIDTKLALFQSKINGQNALFLLSNGDQTSVFGLGSRYGVLYNEFKLIASDPNLQTLEAHGNVVSFEYISHVNPQIIFILDRAAATESGGTTGAVELIRTNALVKSTTAGKNNDIYLLDPMSWYILPGGIESTLQMIEDVEQIFNS